MFSDHYRCLCFFLLWYVWELKLLTFLKYHVLRRELRNCEKVKWTLSEGVVAVAAVVYGKLMFELQGQWFLYIFILLIPLNSCSMASSVSNEWFASPSIRLKQRERTCALLVQFLDVYTLLCDGINVMKLIHSFYWSNRKLMKFNHFLFLFVTFSPPHPSIA